MILLKLKTIIKNKYYKYYKYYKMEKNTNCICILSSWKIVSVDMINFIKMIFKSENVIIDIFVALNNEFPNFQDLKKYKLIIITGSPHSVYENLEWMDTMSKYIIYFYENMINILGICFGHQIIAQTLGSEVKNSGKIISHKEEITLSDKLLKEEFMKKTLIIKNNIDKITINQKHSDEVVYIFNSHLRNGGSSVSCKHEILYVNNCILTFQGHPELIEDTDINKLFICDMVSKFFNL